MTGVEYPGGVPESIAERAAVKVGLFVSGRKDVEISEAADHVEIAGVAAKVLPGDKGRDRLVDKIGRDVAGAKENSVCIIPVFILDFDFED
jgi:hypothetical protein